MSVKIAAGRKKWVHLCVCGHGWESMLRVDNCWVCSKESTSQLDTHTRDSMEQSFVGGDLPLKLEESIACDAENGGHNE